MILTEFPITHNEAYEKWGIDGYVWSRLENLVEDGWCVRFDRSRNGDAFRCRIHRHSGKTFHDFRAACTSTASMTSAVLGVLRKLEVAQENGRVDSRRLPAAECQLVGIWEVGER